MSTPQASPLLLAGAMPETGPGIPELARLVDRVRGALAGEGPLCIRGGGSKDFYGGAPRGRELATRELRGICSYEPAEMVITARAGTPLAEIEAALAESGQCLAFEPPRLGPGSTIGGVVAAGFAGPARAACGSVRDFVLGAVLLNGRGELLRFGGQVMKNVAGYDVSRVLPGSLGILGVICELSLKVLPIAPARQTLVFELPLAAAVERLNRWLAAGLPLNASAWEAGRLVLRLSGAEAAVRASVTRMQSEAGAVALDAVAADALWQGLRDQSAPYFSRAANTLGDDGQHLWRLSVPALAAPLDLPGPGLVEWHGAQRWLLSAAAPDLVREAAARAGGHATIFRSRQRPQDFLSTLPENMMLFHRSLKQAFDPNNIFNNGRLYSWL